MFRKIKKGFTIVELVIVIAVIAVLTAILVPTFINLSQKANKANDNSMVTNLNKALRMAEVDNEIYEGHRLSDTNFTMHDAVLDLRAYGYEINQLVTKSEEKLVYSLKENKFYLSADSEIGQKYASDADKARYLWTIQNSVSGSEVYSVYAGPHWSQPNITNLHVGFDAGYREDIQKIDYTNTAGYTVVIRTDGGTLTINAENDTVNHYGEGVVLDIQAIAGSSYHEFGYFPKASIAQGRLVVEEEGDIPAVEITAVPTSQNPIEIETDKDVVVSASQEVVAEVGSGTLENVAITVTNAEAEVVVDEKIDKDNVDAAGKTADDLVSITKVATYSEFAAALTAKKEYIMFTSDISYATNGTGLLNIDYSATIDGDEFTLSGYGDRGGQKTTLCINNNVGS